MFRKLFSRTFGRIFSASATNVVKEGRAMRVMFFYPGEEGTYIENIHVRVYHTGIVHIRANQEEVTTHIQNCEILWCHPFLPYAQTDGPEPVPEVGNNVRVLRAKIEKSSALASTRIDTFEPPPSDKPPTN